MLSQGATVAVVSKKIGVSDYTYYRWRKEYSGVRVDQAHRLKELEQENSRLKKLVADLSLANASYQIVIEGTSYRERLSPHRRKEVLTTVSTT